MVFLVALYERHTHATAAGMPSSPRAKAAILDQLALTSPNPAFVRTVTAILEEAGFSVDYYKGDKVSVELFRGLPAHNYALIILRVHSAYIEKHRTLALFTSERYSTDRYVYEQIRQRVARGQVDHPAQGDPGCLAITDKFVRFSMNGSFDGALVVMMGCTGIRGGASAFLEKGAGAYIGWDGRVSANHTDRATIGFLKHLLVKKYTIGEAVAETMKQVGQESQYKSLLLFWPLKAAGSRIAVPQNHEASGPGKEST